MRPTLLFRLLAPPRVPEVLTLAQVRAGATWRLVSVVLAIGVDLFIWATFRGAPEMRAEVVSAFAQTNLSLLALDALLTMLLLRRPGRAYKAVLLFCIVLEAFTTIVWIQVTGSVSSYFMVVAIFLPVVYRLFFGYAAGLVAAVSLLVFRVGAFVLEETGVLRPAAIFVTDPGGIYRSATFRGAAMVSISWASELARDLAQVVEGELPDEVRARARRLVGEVAHAETVAATPPDGLGA